MVPRSHVQASAREVQAWSVFRLPFQPRGDALAFRNLLRTYIAAMEKLPGQILTCTYTSSIPGLVDAENVLLYNVGLAGFAKLCRDGLRFERSFEAVPHAPIELAPPGAQHYHHYRSIERDADFDSWRRGDLLASWRDALWPTGPPTVSALWLAIRSALPRVARRASLNARVGLRLEIAGSRTGPNPVYALKPLVDAAISSFHGHSDAAAAGECARRIGTRHGIDPNRIENQMTDGSLDVLGARRVVAPYRTGVKWDPADESCVAVELRRRDAPGSARFSGELFAVVSPA